MVMIDNHTNNLGQPRKLREHYVEQPNRNQLRKLCILHSYCSLLGYRPLVGPGRKEKNRCRHGVYIEKNITRPKTGIAVPIIEPLMSLKYSKKRSIIYGPYGTFDESRHDSNAEPAAAHYEDFDELAPPLEVLRHHQRRAIAC